MVFVTLLPFTSFAVAVVGNNGVGKSTFLKLLIGVLEPVTKFQTLAYITMYSKPNITTGKYCSIALI